MQQDGLCPGSIGARVKTRGNLREPNETIGNVIVPALALRRIPCGTLAIMLALLVETMLFMNLDMSSALD